MKKITIPVITEANLELQSFGHIRLGDFWNHITLSGDHWRFYFHDAPGAFVRLNGKWKEFQPNRAYLLAPCCNLETKCSGHPVQLFLHFTATWLTGTPEQLLYPLPEHFGGEKIAAVRTLMTDRNDTTALWLHSLALCAEALCSIPRNALFPHRPDSRIQTVRNYIDLNLNEELDLAKMARLANLSENAFLRLFRRECATTPYQYLLQQRYHYAARLLRDEDHGIDEICELIGIRDRFHFSRCFKQFFGMAPAAYRRHCRGGKMPDGEQDVQTSGQTG